MVEDGWKIILEINGYCINSYIFDTLLNKIHIFVLGFINGYSKSYYQTLGNREYHTINSKWIPISITTLRYISTMTLHYKIDVLKALSLLI